jgi:hypothetical protein
MKLGQMIAQLTRLHAEVGDVDVSFTDGYNVLSYRGSDFQIDKLFYDNGEITVDISVGFDHLPGPRP